MKYGTALRIGKRKKNVKKLLSISCVMQVVTVINHLLSVLHMRAKQSDTAIQKELFHSDKTVYL